MAARGANATVLVDIASAAAVAPSLLNHYFPSRSDLIGAIAHERVFNVLRAIWQPDAEETFSESERIRCFIQRAIDASHRYPWVPALWLREFVCDGGELRPHVGQFWPGRLSSQAAERMLCAQDAGAVNPDVSPALMYTSALTLLMGLLTIENYSAMKAEGRRRAGKRIGKHVTTLMLYGMGVPSTPTSSTPLLLSHEAWLTRMEALLEQEPLSIDERGLSLESARHLARQSDDKETAD